MKRFFCIKTNIKASMRPLQKVLYRAWSKYFHSQSTDLSLTDFS